MLTVNSDVVSFKPLLWYFVLPIIAGTACWYWMRPGINGLYKYLRWTPILTTVLTSHFSQKYITDKTAYLVRVDSVDQIHEHEKAQYFNIREYNVLKVYVADYDIEVGGKRRRFTKASSVTTYLLFPMTSNESTKQDYKYWYALKFTRLLNANASNAHQMRAAEQFLQECIEELRDYDFKRAKFFELLPDSDLRDHFLQTLATKVSDTTGKEILLAHSEQFQPDDITNALLAITALAVGTAMFFVGFSFR
jgi:hypothetical protein